MKWSWLQIGWVVICVAASILGIVLAQVSISLFNQPQLHPYKPMLDWIGKFIGTLVVDCLWLWIAFRFRQSCIWMAYLVLLTGLLSIPAAIFGVRDPAVYANALLGGVAVVLTFWNKFVARRAQPGSPESSNGPS